MTAQNQPEVAKQLTAGIEQANATVEALRTLYMAHFEHEYGGDASGAVELQQEISASEQQLKKQIGALYTIQEKPNQAALRLKEIRDIIKFSAELIVLFQHKPDFIDFTITNEVNLEASIKEHLFMPPKDFIHLPSDVIRTASSGAYTPEYRDAIGQAYIDLANNPSRAFNTDKAAATYLFHGLTESLGSQSSDES